MACKSCVDVLDATGLFDNHLSVDWHQ